jgi:hypothetical protein
MPAKVEQNDIALQAIADTDIAQLNWSMNFLAQSAPLIRSPDVLSQSGYDASLHTSSCFSGCGV